MLFLVTLRSLPPSPLLCTYCVLYVLALNVLIYCVLYVLALNVRIKYALSGEGGHRVFSTRRQSKVLHLAFI